MNPHNDPLGNPAGAPVESYTDLTPMPFGKYGPGRGDERVLQDVPAGYFHWLAHQPNGISDQQLVAYIKRNLHAFKLENPDLLWKRL